MIATEARAETRAAAAHLARALDDATVILLRATSPRWALHRVELEERFGVPAYGADAERGPALAPRAERIECGHCGRFFWSEKWDQQRYCTPSCRVNASRKRRAEAAA